MSDAAKAQPLVTADELWALPDDGVRRELIAGEVVEMAPAGEEHGRVGGRLVRALSVWLDSHDMAELYLAETGVIVARDPDTVLAPDVALVLKERVAKTPKFSTTIPDLVLEAVSPSARIAGVYRKVGAWLEAGVQVVWVLWSDRQVLQEHRATGEVRVFHATDTLTCEDLLPGFALPLERVFG